MTTSSTPALHTLTTSAGVPLTLRPFREADAARIIEIANRNYPERVRSVEDFLYYDAQWDSNQYERHRVMAEDEDGRLLGWGQISHMQGQFHPRKYGINVAVDPEHQRCGIGSVLYDVLVDELQRRNAMLVRANTQESKTHVVGFLAKRGFGEIQRYWESRLHVPSFDFAPFAGAEERAAREGITITTLAEERERDPSEGFLRRLHALEQAIMADVPLPEPFTPTSFEDFLRYEIDAPNALPDAYFIARDGERMVGLSALWKQRAEPDVLGQGLTGVLGDYRGKGIAMALKVRGLRYAAQYGAREIRTNNNTRNRPMLRINEAMGFEKQPVWIEFEKVLAERA
jgi:GNAT superfamily N-acetyltransferase